MLLQLLLRLVRILGQRCLWWSGSNDADGLGTGDGGTKVQGVRILDGKLEWGQWDEGRFYNRYPLLLQ